MSDPYADFAGKYAYQGSERFKKVLRVLMNDDEVAVANMLPANAEEIAGKTGKPIESINSILAGLFKKRCYFRILQGLPAGARNLPVARCHGQRCAIRRTLGQGPAGRLVGFL